MCGGVQCVPLQKDNLRVHVGFPMYVTKFLYTKEIIKDKHIPWKYVFPLHEYSQLAVPSVEAEHTFTVFPHFSPVAAWSVC